MTPKQIANISKLKEIITKNFLNTKIVTLGDLTKSISKVSNVRVRDCTVEDYYELGVDAINDEGVLTIPKNPKRYSPANESAIVSQRLQKGDLIFGYRGKMGKVGLIADEFTTPVVTNNGMIRITFEDDRVEDTPLYIQTYLKSNLIRTYLNSMLEDRNGKSVLNVQTVATLPIPYFEDMAGISKFSTLVNRRKRMTLEARAIIEEAQKVLQLHEEMESESIMLQTLSVDELSPINSADHIKQDALQQITLQLQVLKNTQSLDNILSKEFESIA